MQRAKPGDTVRLHYTGRLEDGTVFDTSTGHAPIQFTISAGLVIYGLDQAIVGMGAGEERCIRVPAHEAHGQHRDDLVLELRRDQMLDHVEPEVGQVYEIRNDDGSKADYRVTAVSPTEITLDANHPLAGKDLVFTVQLIEILEKD
jgi:peptidylprolyl isomerase